MTTPLPPELQPVPEISGIALMNIAALGDDSLGILRRFYVQVRDHGTEDGRAKAPAYLAAIDAELESRGVQP